MSFLYYVPIHVHTDFSNGDALLDVDEYVKWAKENNYPAIAITDHGNLSASLYFNQVAIKAGVKSIIGLEAYCAFRKEFDSEDKDEKRERDHFILIAKNYQGYLDLCWLLGQSMRNSFYYKPIILYEDLLQYNKNLIVSSACMGGRIPKLIMEDKEKEAIEFIQLMKKTFGEDFYLEIMEVQMSDQTAFNQWAIRNHKRLGVKLIWTTDTHYFKPEHVDAHDAMKLINSKTSFKDDDWQKRVYTSRNLWLKKREDIIEEAKTLNYDLDIVNEALDNTIEIEQKVENVKLTRAPEVIMPKFSDNSYEILEKKVMEELVRREWDKRPGYLERVKSELEVIKFKRMEDYFLIVADIVNYAENNDVMCGAGRGSGAGSLVVCLLGITKIDPIKYNLYFERFLNPKRLDPPDIDLDFDSKTRYKIEIYLKQKYGINSVSHVISFGTFGIKNSIKDVFRVYFGTDKKDCVDLLSKCLEDEDDNFDEALKKMITLEGKWAEDFITEHKKLFDIARVLVGKNRHYSMHAGGVIIAPDSLEKYIPIMRIGDNIATGYPEGGDTRLMTDAGLMKFDLLGLNACTIINDTLKQLKDVTVSSITENDSDPKVLEQFTKANTFSIFQFEGKKISSFVKKAKPTRFTDLVAANALYRPAVIQAGGLDMYLKNKENFNEEEADKDPFRRILKETYDVICYQEQTMQVFQQLGGFTLAEADETRHVFKLLFKGKSDYTEFNHVMEKFRKGCHERTDYSDEKIEEIMELMKQFSKYCFNKCISGNTKILVFKKIKCKKEGQPNASRYIVCNVLLSDLYKDYKKYSGIAMYDEINKKSKMVPIKEVMKTGKKETYCVYVQSGGKKRIINATLDHKFFTPSGWKTLRELKVDDEVLIKRGKSVNVGENNCWHHSKGPVHNKGKKYKFTKTRVLHLPLEYSNKKRSEAALKRTVQGRTGKPFSKESLDKLRRATIKRFQDGKFPTKETSINKKVFSFVSTLESHEFKKEYPIEFGVLDIAEPNLKIAIECQGSFFHADPRFYPDRTKFSAIQRKNRRRDFLKRRWLKENGWTLVELWEEDINKNFDFCKEQILIAISDYQENPWEFKKIVALEKFGEEETYDIHVDHPDHNYIANGFVVHNSHSCAYAMMAYIMMYLRTYHPTQYFASLLSNTDNSETKQDGKNINLFQHYAMTIQKDFGINIHKPDVNTSGADFFRIAEDGGLIYALGHIKDVGLKAAVNIQENQPYTSFKDFLSRVTRRIVNKRVIKGLIYAEALRFEDTQELFEKEFKEKIDTVNFLQKQFAHTSLIVSKDLKQATDKEYSLKGVEKAVSEGRYLTKKDAIPIIVFMSKIRRMAGNSKKTGRPYIMYFATLYDGTTTIDDCILNDVEKLGLVEGDLVKGKLYFSEAKNKKYSEHVFYLGDIQKIHNTEKYEGLAKFKNDGLGKFKILNEIKIEEKVAEEVKSNEIKEKVEETSKVNNEIEIKEVIEDKPKFISRKRLIIEQTELPLEIKSIEVIKKEEVIEEKPKFISRKKIKIEQIELPLDIKPIEVIKKEEVIENKPRFISRKKNN